MAVSRVELLAASRGRDGIVVYMGSPTELTLLSLFYQAVSLTRRVNQLASDELALEYLLNRHTALFQNISVEVLRAAVVKRSGNSEAAAIHLANTYANPQQKRTQTEEELPPIFGQVELEGDGLRDLGSYPLRAFAEGVAYPSRSPKPAAYDGLARRFDERLSALAVYRPDDGVLLANVVGFLHEVAWCIPVPGTATSLYDHARLAAAITGVFGVLINQGTPIDNERDTLFMLVVGDVSGIQNHIYRIRSTPTGTGALAKRLRARSLEVALSAEAMARDILHSLELPLTQRVMSAGGKFYLLLPNSDATLKVLTEIKEQWEQHSLEQGATLIPQLAWSAFSGRDFSRFPAVVQQVHQRLATAKLRPLSSQLASPYLYGTGESRPCAAYGHLPAEAGSELSRQAQRDRALGTELPRVQALTFVSAKVGDNTFRFPNSSVGLGEREGDVLRNTFDFTPSAAAWEVRPLLGHLPTVREAMRAKSCDLTAYRTWLTKQGLDASEDELKRREAGEHDPLTFGELAALSEGVPLLGALMLDADRMGEVFARGMPRAGPSQVAALSRMIETFFAAEVGRLIRKPGTYADILEHSEQDHWKVAAYPLIYSVYAGGDDLLLLGPWQVLLAFSLDLNRLYKKYTAHPAFSLSGGFALVRPKLPIVQLSEEVRELERQTKTPWLVVGQRVIWLSLDRLSRGLSSPS